MRVNIFDLDENETNYLIQRSHNCSDIARRLGYVPSSSIIKKIKQRIIKYNIDISHFDQKIKTRVYPIVSKECPACGKSFKVSKGSPREETTCSYACSNTYFRSGRNNPNWKETAYRSTCFLYHKKECVICNEVRIVEVHHYDCNKNNNEIDNLVPLCPNHHQLFHSRFRQDVEPYIIEYIKNFKLSKNHKSE